MVEDFDLEDGLLECLAIRILDPLGRVADRYEREVRVSVYACRLSFFFN